MITATEWGSTDTSVNSNGLFLELDLEYETRESVASQVGGNPNHMRNLIKHLVRHLLEPQVIATWYLGN